MELLGVLAAVLSSGLGGTSIGATRYVVGATDPLTLGVFRFGIGCLLLLPVVLVQGGWPKRADWPGVVGLGLLFFGLFPILFNASLAFTTAARGALALSTLPLLTMLTASVLRIERLSARKSVGVLVAMAGVATALFLNLAETPDGAWRGDLLMIAAAFCMALYSIWSKPFIRRSSPIAFTTMGMAAGAVCLGIVSAASGGIGAAWHFDLRQWAAVLYLGIFGAAAAFWLWALALRHTTPTRVAISVTVNPIAASVVGALLLGEPFHWNVGMGLVMVLAGIGIAVTGGSRDKVPTLPSSPATQPASLRS